MLTDWAYPLGGVPSPARDPLEGAGASPGDVITADGAAVTQKKSAHRQEPAG
jgi:hypothetical protein